MQQAQPLRVLPLLLSLSNIAGGDIQVEDDFGDLDDTQVAELGRKSKEDSVAKDMLTCCAEDAASRATSELKAITSQLLQDAADRDQRLAERDAALVEKLAELRNYVSESVDSKISNLSESMNSKIDNLEQRMQYQWKVFQKRWTEK